MKSYAELVDLNDYSSLVEGGKKKNNADLFVIALA